MQVSVKNQNGDALESIELNDAVFRVPMNPTLVHQAMVIYQGNKRQGTHDTKTRAQVSGGGRKPWIQKHTGRARQGSTRSPQWRHGGVVFGPHPRSYRAALPKRMKRQALRCVLSDKARHDRLFCLDSTSTIDGKTKSMAQLLQNLAVSGSALVVTMGTNRDVVLAAHNLKKIWTLPADQLNAQELLARDTVIMTVEAARWVEETLATEPHGRRGVKWNTSIAVVVDAPSDEDWAEDTAEYSLDDAPAAEEPSAAEAEDTEPEAVVATSDDETDATGTETDVPDADEPEDDEPDGDEPEAGEPETPEASGPEEEA